MNEQQYTPQRFRVLPPVVKNLLIINTLVYLASIFFDRAFNIDLNYFIGIHYPASEAFMPFQFFTYMFAHASLSHLFFNMFALWMFGNVVENVFGSKRFLLYYIICGIGAALVNYFIFFLRIKFLEKGLSPDVINMVYDEGLSILNHGQNYTNASLAKLNNMVNSTTVGASGAVYGLLLAFGMLFPNALIYLYFFIPMKAKWFVIIFGAIELISGITPYGSSNIAHFAHLGGMIFGLILILIWRKKYR